MIKEFDGNTPGVPASAFVSETVLDDPEVGAYCIIGAGCVVSPGMKIPDKSLVFGVPGKIAG